ncbi:YgfZ/GcvT domain-containing protein [Cryptosporangium sp. NPDC048952]|uniref:CAF17-like 4Fe-4S cluster assembly/insertion protein YgfZ n=1 Tax=Cryptosporangium sp. NPDC048952 TaxID=3363961 RepID=UPI003717DEC3
MSPLSSRPGAVLAEGADAGVAAHYGDPFREQRHLSEDVGVVDRSNRGVIAVPGADRLSWLHSLTSQHLDALPAWHGTEALVLSPHGHVEHHFLVGDDGNTTWLDVEPGTTEALLGYLQKMVFFMRVEPTDVTADWAVLSVIGPSAGAALSRLGVELPSEPYALVALPDGGFVRRMPWPGEVAADLLVPRDRMEAVVDRLDAPLAGTWAYEALRVADRRPRLAFETDHRTIVQEPEWIPTAVHLEKGCYRGQETVARVHNLGRPPRRMVLVHLDGVSEELPAQGTAITLGRDGRAVGFVGTAVRHFELGHIALGLVKRNIPDDADLWIGETKAAIDPSTDLETAVPKT